MHILSITMELIESILAPGYNHMRKFGSLPKHGIKVTMKTMISDVSYF